MYILMSSTFLRKNKKFWGISQEIPQRYLAAEAILVVILIVVLVLIVLILIIVLAAILIVILVVLILIIVHFSASISFCGYPQQ